VEKHFFKRLQNAHVSVRRQSKVTPLLGIITGSGLGGILEKIDGQSIPYRQIRQFPRTGVKGHPGVMKISPRVVILGGRFHLYETVSTDDVVLPVFLLSKLGVRRLILTNASGGINPHYELGDLVLIRDHINLTGHNPLQGPHASGYGPRFPDMSDTYSRILRNRVKERFPKMKEGIYAGMLGPSYETPAEIAMLKGLGADMVGMSTVPEAIAARFLGIDVLGISCITNKTGARSAAGLSHDEVIAVGMKAAQELSELLAVIIDLISEE
jgi:purine-nucleoside phosphorylase